MQASSAMHSRNSKNCFRSCFACTKFSLAWYLLTWTWPHDLPSTCSMNPLDGKQPTCCVCLPQSHPVSWNAPENLPKLTQNGLRESCPKKTQKPTPENRPCPAGQLQKPSKIGTPPPPTPLQTLPHNPKLTSRGTKRSSHTGSLRDNPNHMRTFSIVGFRV